MGEAFMPDTMRPPAYASLLPISPAAEVFRDRIGARRTGLKEHNYTAIELAGVALRAHGSVTNGHTPDVRCDRSERLRRLQVEGTEGLPSEDIFAIALENDLGRDAVIAWAQVLLSSVGWRAVPNEASDAPGALLVATAKVARESGEFLATVAEAQADGRIDLAENEKIEAQAHRLAQDIQVAARVAANEARQGRPVKEGGR